MNLVQRIYHQFPSNLSFNLRTQQSDVQELFDNRWIVRRCLMPCQTFSFLSYSKRIFEKIIFQHLCHITVFHKTAVEQNFKNLVTPLTKHC